jgi:nucleoid DNA-binding protein
MPRVKIDWRSASLDNYKTFCKKEPTIKITFDEWLNIIYTFNESFRNHILETGDKLKMPYGFGEFSINKKKRKRMVNVDGIDRVALPVDWQKTKLKGKVIYNFNYHTDGYFFGWVWFKTVKLKNSKLWYFKPSRTTSRMLSHYIKTDEKYQHIYKEWKK